MLCCLRWPDYHSVRAAGNNTKIYGCMVAPVYSYRDYGGNSVDDNGSGVICYSLVIVVMVMVAEV